jgi:hypothetical protein
MSAHHTTTDRGCVRLRVADWDTTRRGGSRGRPAPRRWVWSTAAGFGGYWTLV